MVTAELISMAVYTLHCCMSHFSRCAVRVGEYIVDAALDEVGFDVCECQRVNGMSVSGCEYRSLP